MDKNETESILDDFSGVRCSCCKYHGKDCKRFNGRLQPYRPYFVSDGLNNHMICRDFEPASHLIYIRKHWCGFDKFIEAMRTEYVAYRPGKTIGVWLDDNTDLTYEVSVDDFFDGNLWKKDGTLNYVAVWYYKQTRSGFGWEIIRKTKEDIEKKA